MSVLWWLSVCSLLETAHPVRSFALSFHIPSSSQILKPVVSGFFFVVFFSPAIEFHGNVATDFQ